jgi:hypothetical protein
MRHLIRCHHTDTPMIPQVLHLLAFNWEAKVRVTVQDPQASSLSDSPTSYPGIYYSARFDSVAVCPRRINGAIPNIGVLVNIHYELVSACFSLQIRFDAANRL